MLPMGTRDLALRVKILPMGTREKKKKPSTDDGQLFIKVALRSNILYRFFFATGPPLRLRSRPPDSGFAGVLPRHCRHVIHAHLLGFWKLRNFLRPINASMKEATAKRPLLRDFIKLEINDFPVPADSSRSPQPAVALQIDGFLKDFNQKTGAGRSWPLALTGHDSGNQ